ncbi:MAG: tetratricopeptide (TPR) repeat protein [Planctomycetota bacterium]|jgi:tetratricopeptide (TPR) repeat protein
MRQAILSLLLCMPAVFGQETLTADIAIARWTEDVELGLYPSVVREARAALQANPKLASNAEFVVLYARALARSGGYDEAYERLHAIGTAKQTAGVVAVALAQLELEEDKLREVIARLALSDPQQPLRYPALPEAWVVLGKARYRLGEVDAAIPLLQQFVTNWRMHPEAPSAWHMLAQASMTRRDMQGARTAREQGQNLATWHAFYRTRRIQVREAPQDPLPRFGLAQLWSSVEELDRALEEVHTTLKLDPEFARAWALQGEIERKRGNQGKALEAYGKALKLDSSLSDARFNRALLALEAKDDELARSDLELIVNGPEQTAERYLGAHLALARFLKRIGEDEAAEARFARYEGLGGSAEL